MKMGLRSLREHISVIPQIPFIFRGSVRENIDPYFLFDDAELWLALEKCGLKEKVMRWTERLETELGGQNRLHTVVDCDRIAVLSDGKVSEIGTALYLVEKKGELF